MKLGKKVKSFIIFSLLFLFLAKTTLAATTNTFVTVVNPIRGEDLFGLTFQKNLISQYQLPATWLLRFDALASEPISTYLKAWPVNQELGIFLEITPKLAEKVGINYPSGGLFWHDANKIFLSGYKPEDRLKLIDGVFNEFKEKFGHFPQSVGAWHVDAYSAAYMQKQYGVTGVLICADQFGTDGYQIWGGWWGVPYYPSKFNILTPAQTQKNKLDLVVFWWAARDPDLGYGGSVNESTFSFQANDYLSHGLDINYFKKLLDIYLKNPANRFGQVTIGLENDNDWEKIGEEYQKQLAEIEARRTKGEISVVVMKEFAQWYRNQFTLSPEHRIAGWLMSPGFRLGTAEKNGRQIIRDLRIYNENWPEANLLSANPWGTLSLNNPYKIDTVRFANSTVEKNNEKFEQQSIPFEFSKYLLLSYCSIVSLLLIVFLRKNLPLLFLVFLGSVSLSLTMVKSGLVYPYGLGFWGPNGHDGIWHMALINELSHFSLGNPVFAGALLTNYHFGFDLLVAIFSRLTGLDPVNLYFQILPPVMAVLIGVMTYRLVEQIASRKSAWWATFFVYFGGSWGWILGKGESTFWANQAISTLINPPYALSLIFLLWGCRHLLTYLEKPSGRNLLFCALIFGALIQIKVYAGILVLGSLLVTSFFAAVFRRDIAGRLFKLSAATAAFSLLIFLPFNLKASSLLVFSPFWFSRTMLAFADRVGWFKLENARITYQASGQWFKWLLAESLALVIFVLGNLGTRIVGIFSLLGKKGQKPSLFSVFLLTFLLFSLVVPLLFIQKGNPWNTIQFFYYFQFLMAIFAGVTIGKFNNILIYFTIVLLTVLTLPTSIITLKNNYLPGRPPSRVSVEELEALAFLAKQPNGVVMAYPYNPLWREKFTEPRPLYAYETTAYVSALSGQETYLEDEMNLEISGYGWKDRREKSLRFFSTDSHVFANEFIKANKVRYIYLVKGQKMNLGENDINAQKIFENGEVVIYRIN